MSNKGHVMPVVSNMSHTAFFYVIFNTFPNEQHIQKQYLVYQCERCLLIQENLV